MRRSLRAEGPHPLFLYPCAVGRLSFFCCAGMLISAMLRYSLFFVPPESLGRFLPCAMGNICGLRRSQASAWPEVATFLIKRKWPKIDQGGPWTPLRRQAVQGGSGLARHWFRGRLQASALPLVRQMAVLRSAGLPEGPGSLARHWFRGRFQAAFWAPGQAVGLPP